RREGWLSQPMESCAFLRMRMDFSAHGYWVKSECATRSDFARQNGSAFCDRERYSVRNDDPSILHAASTFRTPRAVLRSWSRGARRDWLCRAGLGAPTLDALVHALRGDAWGGLHPLGVVAGAHYLASASSGICDAAGRRRMELCAGDSPAGLCGAGRRGPLVSWLRDGSLRWNAVRRK